MKYQIALTSVIWTPDYQNVRRFGSRAAQETYFDVANKFTSAVPVRNLDYGNFLRLSVFVKTGQAGIGNIMTANYAIIKDITNANAPKYYYYFITNSSFDSVDQVKIDLEIDVIQTFYIDMTFGEGMIERAHLNRWLSSGKLNVGHNFNFWQRDSLQGLPKYVKSYETCSVSPFAPTNTISAWLETNVYAWIYAFLDKGTYTNHLSTYSTQMAYSTLRTSSHNEVTIDSPYVVVCCPIIGKSGKSIKVNTKEITMANFIDFVNSNIAHVYNIKVSQFPPFARSNAPTCVINGDVLEITASTLDAVGQTNQVCFVNKQYLGTQYLTKQYTLPQHDITKTSIDTYAKDKAANPKLFGADYRGLKIVYGGNEYMFDIQKLADAETSLGNGKLTFSCFELLTAEISPTFITYEPTALTSLYGPIGSAMVNMVGYLNKNDFSLPYAENQLDTFLANNKNFFAQKEAMYTEQRAQRAVSGISNIISGLGGAAASGVSGDIGGAFKQGIGAIGGVAVGAMQNELQIAYDKANTAYTLDNMQAGVDNLRNANGNAFFNFACNDMKIILQEVEGIPQDIGRAEEDMHENGYVYNRMGNVKDFDNIRSKFNYIKATIEIIKTPVKISNEVRNIVKQIFARGVRFWNTDDWTLEQMNLEN